MVLFVTEKYDKHKEFLSLFYKRHLIHRYRGPPSPTGEGWQKSLLSSARVLDSRPRHPFFSGRADNACTNLLGFFVRYVRTRGSMRLRGAVKLPTFALPFPARACHARLARLTRARRGGSEGGRRESSLLTFGTFGHAKVQERKSCFMFLYGGSKPYPVSATPFRGGYATLNPPLLHRKVR